MRLRQRLLHGCVGGLRAHPMQLRVACSGGCRRYLVQHGRFQRAAGNGAGVLCWEFPVRLHAVHGARGAGECGAVSNNLSPQRYLGVVVALVPLELRYERHLGTHYQARADELGGVRVAHSSERQVRAAPASWSPAYCLLLWRLHCAAGATVAIDALSGQPFRISRSTGESQVMCPRWTPHTAVSRPNTQGIIAPLVVVLLCVRVVTCRDLALSSATDVCSGAEFRQPA